MDDIKPIGWISYTDIKDADRGYEHGPLKSEECAGYVPVYDQSAIDALQAGIERLNEYADDYRETIGDLVSELESAASRIKHLESANIAYSQQVAELIGRAGNAERNAARYVWLRDLPIGSPYEQIGNLPGDVWDEEIDAAMKEQG